MSISTGKADEFDDREVNYTQVAVSQRQFIMWPDTESLDTGLFINGNIRDFGRLRDPLPPPKMSDGKCFSK
ncbi:hypothetical protein ACTXT7_015232 [Hymenolepis weldensis]